MPQFGLGRFRGQERGKRFDAQRRQIGLSRRMSRLGAQDESVIPDSQQQRVLAQRKERESSLKPSASLRMKRRPARLGVDQRDAEAVQQDREVFKGRSEKL